MRLFLYNCKTMKTCLYQLLINETSPCSQREPVNPSLHEHWNEPSVFTQSPPFRQGKVAHSLTSK